MRPRPRSTWPKTRRRVAPVVTISDRCPYCGDERPKQLLRRTAVRTHLTSIYSVRCGKCGAEFALAVRGEVRER